MKCCYKSANRCVQFTPSQHFHHYHRKHYLLVYYFVSLLATYHNQPKILSVSHPLYLSIFYAINFVFCILFTIFIWEFCIKCLFRGENGLANTDLERPPFASRLIYGRRILRILLCYELLFRIKLPQFLYSNVLIGKHLFC